MTGPPPPVAAVRVAVRRAFADLPARSHVLVACSGGPDSLALAAATAFVAPRAGLTAGAAVVDHGWHAASASVAAAAADACARLGLEPVQVIDVSSAAAQGSGGPEAAARDVRYAALDRAADEQGAVAVLLGHTLDDQAETVLLGLARGSGARSLAGMPARRARLVRPLLDLPRATTHAACEALGLVAHEDPANADPAYARARLRAAMGLLEETLGPGVAGALARTAGQLAQDADALDAWALALVGQSRVPGGYDVEVLAAAPDAVRRRALLAVARAAGAPAGALGSRHAGALDALVLRASGASSGRSIRRSFRRSSEGEERPEGRRGPPHGPVHLPGGLVATCACGTLSLAEPGAGQERAEGRPAGQPEGQEERAAQRHGAGPGEGPAHRGADPGAAGRARGGHRR